MRWLEEHPCGVPEVDALWTKALEGEGPLARWLASDASLDAWNAGLPLRCLLSSHPFPDLLTWSIRATSNAS